MKPNKELFLITLFSFTLAGSIRSQPSASPPVVVERGPFYRVWQTSSSTAGSPPGEVQSRRGTYTELGNGLCYQENGLWLDSQDLIEIEGNVAIARRGPTKVIFNANINTPDAVDLVTVSGKRLQTRVIGLYYFDAKTGETATIALVKDSTGVLYAPNQVAYADAFDRVSADIVYTYAKGGFDQTIVLLEPLPTPEAYGLNSSSTRLQVYTEFLQAPRPAIRQRVLKRQPDPQLRKSMASPDLTDEILDFGDLWFPTGAAFRWNSNNQAGGGQPAAIRLPDPSDPENVLIGKKWTDAGDKNILIESVDYLDIAPKLAGSLKTAALKKPGGARLGRQATRRAALQKDTSRSFLVAGAPYTTSGFALDFTTLSGGVSSYTFNAMSTYVINNSFWVGPGTATFAANCTVKYAFNAYMILYGTVSFPATGLPVVLTSLDDNAYGELIPGSTSAPNYAASQAIWMYFDANPTTVKNVRVRWAQRGIQYDESPGVGMMPVLSNSSFQNCTVGVYLNLQSDSLTLSQVTACSVAIPIYLVSGGNSGSITPDCGVVSVARVNDTNQDLTIGDPDKNSQSECSFTLVNSSRIVAAFFDTHLSKYALGQLSDFFPEIIPPRSIGWAVSTDGGASFTDQGPLLPNPPQSASQGDAGDPVMARDMVNGTIYLLGNPSRESGSWKGFRLWKSTDDGASFTLINTNVPPTGSNCDKPMIAVNNFPDLSTSHHLYVAGTSWGANGIIVTHSGDSGTSWDGTQVLGSGHGADIAIRPNGTVYVFCFARNYVNPPGAYQYSIQFRWLQTGTTNWFGPATVNAHPDSQLLYSPNDNGNGKLLRSNSAQAEDFFDSNAFPRVAVNPVNGKIYLVYADLPSQGSMTDDRGDIFVQEGTANGDGSLNWSGAIRVNNDRTTTDQWNPATAVNPAGTELFIGYYSRQIHPSQNDLIMAYGAKANISLGLVGATFDVIPISAKAFAPLFPGTTVSTPPGDTWLYDHVWTQTDVCLDSNAYVVGASPCSPETYRTSLLYEHFMADDYTWASSDSSFFYFAWCDRSDTFVSGAHSRPDANIRLAKIKQ